MTSPASPPLPAAASRRSVSAPEASLALWAPQSRGHGLADTFLRRGAAGPAAPGWAPSHHLAEGRPRPRDHRSGPSSEARSTDRQTDRRHQRVPDCNCGQRQGNAGCTAGLGRARRRWRQQWRWRWVAPAHLPLRGRGCPRILRDCGLPLLAIGRHSQFPDSCPGDTSGPSGDLGIPGASVPFPRHRIFEASWGVREGIAF